MDKKYTNTVIADLNRYGLTLSEECANSLLARRWTSSRKKSLQKMSAMIERGGGNDCEKEIQRANYSPELFT